MKEVHDGTSCAVAATSELIGSKWTALIVHDLSEGPAPLHPARARVPRHQPAHALRAPAHARAGRGSASARSYPESPPRVEYELTEKGAAMLPIIEAMRTFGHEWLIDDHDHEHTPPRAPRVRDGGDCLTEPDG